MSHDGVAFINVSLASFDTNTNLMKDGFYHHDINIIVFRNDAIIYRGCQVLRPQRGELQREQRRVQLLRPNSAVQPSADVHQPPTQVGQADLSELVVEASDVRFLSQLRRPWSHKTKPPE